MLKSQHLKLGTGDVSFYMSVDCRYGFGFVRYGAIHESRHSTMISNTEMVKAMNVLQEMLFDRGIDASSMCPSHCCNAAFEVYTGGVMIIVNVSPKTARSKSAIELPGNSSSYRIIVVADKLNVREVEKLTEHSIANKYNFQLFYIRDLQFNISRHMLVPKHEVISSDDEIAQIVTEHQLKTKTQLPQINRNDPMSKYLYAKPGHVMKINRISQTARHHIVYRCVV